MMIDFACKKINVDDIIRCSFGLSKSELSLFLLLQKKSSFLSAQQVADLIGKDITTSQRLLKRLYSVGVIDRRQHNLKKGGYTYIYMVYDRSIIKDKLKRAVTNWSSRALNAIDNL